MAALNYKGEESEQSKERRKRKADMLAGKGSVADKVKVQRKAKQKRLQGIMDESVGMYFKSK